MKTPVKILVVDDDPVHLGLLEQLLLTCPGYRVLKATGVVEALEIAERHFPSLIISDYYMPDGNGFSLCRKIKEHANLYDTMFMMLTVATETKKKIEGLGSGADDYLTKPFDEDEFLSRVQALLRIKGLQDELKEDARQLESLNQELEKSFMGVISLLTHLIGLRVPNASIRGQRAAQIVDWMGERLGVEPAELKMIRIAALLHEIGKITLSDELVVKEMSAYSHEEREKVMQFPLMGRLLLTDIPQLRDVGEYLRYQMENYDGTGYPDRLMKDEISLGSRMLRGVNLFEELESRFQKNASAFLAELSRSKSTILDPHIAQLLEEFVLVNADATWLSGKRQVSVYQLQEGMVLASDLYTGSGIKLLPKDSVIRLSSIEKILQHHHFDPIINSILIYSGATA